ncbi:MAG: pyruvate, phosphate dikinase [Planctomycetota bacterium]|nr:pyruvate, phosphate dikinase [Planctomycetota bacterium]
MVKNKRVYFFGSGKAEGRGLAKDILGGKGQGLAEMSSIGLPVPAGFTITVDTCRDYYRLGRVFPTGLKEEVQTNLKRLEKTTGKTFGDAQNPLLVSVRSGAARSMPGMMETILNLGLNDVSVEGLAAKTKNPRFAYDAYRRFIQMYSTTAMGLSKEPMEELLTQTKKRLGVATDPEIPAESLKELCQEYKEYYRQNKGSPFPQDAMDQLWGAIQAVFGSWEADKAVTYRRVEKITDLTGTAVNVQEMVFGNTGDQSGTGVCFTRDPSTGKNEFFGECLINAQGEDVVAGIRTPLMLSDLGKPLPTAWKELQEVRLRLEKHYRDMQDMEFTVENGKLFMLQCRVGKRTPAAAFKMAVDMVNEKLITREEAVTRITPEDIERIFYPVIAETEEKLKEAFLGEAINAVPGAASGQIMLTAEAAETARKDGKKVILVRQETSPEDVGGMHAAQGILTATGGKTSHAAVVARGWGKCCIVGAEFLRLNFERLEMEVAGRVFKQGDWLTLDGSTGRIYAGELPLKAPILPQEYQTLMGWCDQIRQLRVRTNADSPADAVKAIEMGAEGIGLCRTEHMFFEGRERQLAIQTMIVADNEPDRRAALARLLPFQRADFEGIFTAMDGKPVTIRLIDPPLHEFTPKDEEGIAELAAVVGLDKEKVRQRVDQLHEANPMLGLRGCRLCITYPEILEMQVQAIIEAAVNVQGQGKTVFPEIMIPLTMAKKEFDILEARVRAVADPIIKAANGKLHYLVGTMIEIPRAALIADQLAERAEFFSFGTNDLTQMTMGLSRDDAGRFLPAYVDPKRAAIFDRDPFQVLDQEGVGQLVEMGIAKGRKTRPNIKVGICGEHGGELESVKFCCRLGMNYVSCSPFRVPIARLAAAQYVAVAKIKEAAKKSKPANKPAKPVVAKKAVTKPSRKPAKPVVVKKAVTKSSSKPAKSKVVKKTKSTPKPAKSKVVKKTKSARNPGRKKS